MGPPSVFSVYTISLDLTPKADALMLRVFQNDILDPDQFIVTLELVPGRESVGRSLDTVMGIARDAFADGRVSAVSITDNPGGNPALSPDALGYNIFNLGMDVIVHFTCRDTNRVGMESRALQLAMMGMKNILALTGDYAGQGFGGQGAPVFDLDSVQLQIMMEILSSRMAQAGDPDGFFSGCAVSPFKKSEAECFAQYAKLCRKLAAGTRFIITQLGYDARKFAELMGVLNHIGSDIPVLGSVYLLTPGSARIMHGGKVPGAVVPHGLKTRIDKEWRDKAFGRTAAIERAARLAAILKGLGYRGIHIGGIHKDFAVAGKILDRMAALEKKWEAFLPDFDYPMPQGFYLFDGTSKAGGSDLPFGRRPQRPSFLESLHYHFLSAAHGIFFDFDSPLASLNEKICRFLDRSRIGRRVMHILEDPAKKLLLGCQGCGDCGIQHVGFLCPESGCPKHTRNGACGGSHKGRCEVYPERFCVWYRAYGRTAAVGKTSQLREGCVPPRMWELNKTSSWLNFHLRRDHQSLSNEIATMCRTDCCRL
jgi:methylenetetrahydrofolate reductase (NADPH)